MKGKNNKLRKLQKSVKGITLIALVVTIIVLLILAGVAINLTIGQNGIFKRAELSANKWKEASQNEQNEMDKVAEYIDDLTPKYIEGVLIPKGFYYAGGSKDTGIVISDNEDDKKEYNEENRTGDVSTDLKGNQFVWVPVPDPSKIFKDETVKLNGVETTTDVYSKLTIISKDSHDATKPGDSSYYSVREPDVLSKYDTEAEYADIILGTSGTGNAEELAKVFVADYKAMSDSIKKYKGFYIGRYELTGEVDKPTEKKGPVLTAASWQAKNWYGLYKACKGFTKGNVTSTMVYGCQWDATMEWLKETKFKDEPSKVDSDSSSWGNYASSGGTGSPINTGSNSTYQANKIFDLAGNYRDWTQEAVSSSDRVERGSSYMSSGSEAAGRANFSPDTSFDLYTSRPTLYINPYN